MSTATARGSGSPVRALPAKPRRWELGGFCRYVDGVHELRLLEPPEELFGLPAPGLVEFSLIDGDPLMLIGYRSRPGSPLMVVEYLTDGDLPSLGGPFESRAMIAVLAPGENGEVRMLGTFTLSLDFTRALHSSIREHAVRPCSDRERRKAREEMPSRWPTAGSLVAHAGVRTIGCA